MKTGSSNHFALEASDGKSINGGVIRHAYRENFPVLQGLAIQTFRLERGGVRPPHVHPNAAQLDYCVSGRARVGLIGPGGEAQIMDLEPGDVSFIPQGHVHWIENRGEDTLHFLLVLASDTPETIMLSDAVAGVPDDIMARA